MLCWRRHSLCHHLRWLEMSPLRIRDPRRGEVQTGHSQAPLRMYGGHVGVGQWFPVAANWWFEFVRLLGQHRERRVCCSCCCQEPPLQDRELRERPHAGDDSTLVPPRNPRIPPTSAEDGQGDQHTPATPIFAKSGFLCFFSLLMRPRFSSDPSSWVQWDVLNRDVFLSRLEPLLSHIRAWALKGAAQVCKHSLLSLHRDAVTSSHSCPSLTHSVFTTSAL